MREYWNEGNNQSFILLLDLVKRAKLKLENPPDDASGDDNSDDDEVEKTHRQKAQQFWDSFASGAHLLWQKLSSPFQKEHENIKSFIAQDDDIEEGSEDEVVNHASLHREWAAKADDSDENDFAHKLQRQYAEGNSRVDEQASSSSDEELEIVKETRRRSDDRVDSSDDDEDEEALVSKRGYYSPVEEETDDWMLSRLDHKKKKSTPTTQSSSKRKAVVSSTPVGKKLRSKSTSSATKDPVVPIQLSAAKRTPAIQDSDEDD